MELSWAKPTGDRSFSQCERNDRSLDGPSILLSFPSVRPTDRLQTIFIRRNCDHHFRQSSLHALLPLSSSSFQTCTGLDQVVGWRLGVSYGLFVASKSACCTSEQTVQAVSLSQFERKHSTSKQHFSVVISHGTCHVRWNDSCDVKWNSLWQQKYGPFP